MIFLKREFGGRQTQMVRNKHLACSAFSWQRLRQKLQISSSNHAQPIWAAGLLNHCMADVDALSTPKICSAWISTWTVFVGWRLGQAPTNYGGGEGFPGKFTAGRRLEAIVKEYGPIDFAPQLRFVSPPKHHRFRHGVASRKDVVDSPQRRRCVMDR